MRKTLLCLSLAAFSAHASAQSSAQGTFKVAFIDPLSGPFAEIGELMHTHIKYAIEDINAKGGVLNGTKMELISIDNKLSPQESLIALQSAIDAGARVVFTGGSGSTAVGAMVEAANKNNERNPDKAILIVNHSSIDPELTGKRCSFWHFMTEANTAMKMKALTAFMKEKQDIKNVYLLNQNYAHGQMWAKLGKEMLSSVRQDVKFVGEDLHPIGQVKDFSPYVSKIKAAGADTVITGNWGNDLNLLVKAAADAGTNLRFINHSAGGVPGTVLAVSQAKAGQLTWVGEWHPNVENPKVTPVANGYKQRYNKSFLAPRIEMSPRMIAAAIEKAKSIDPLKIVLALEGTNYGFRTETVVEGKDLALPTECKMKRPSGA